MERNEWAGQDPAGAAPDAAAPKKNRKNTGAGYIKKKSVKKRRKTVTSTKKIVKELRPTRVSAKTSPIALLEKALLEISDDPWYNKEEFQRKAIAYVLENSFGCPEESEWHKNTKVSLIQKIKDRLDIPRGTEIEYILRDCLWHKKKGTTYNGEPADQRSRRFVVAALRCM